MTDVEFGAICALDYLFDRISVLAALRGHERDATRDEMRRLIERAFDHCERDDDE